MRFLPRTEDGWAVLTGGLITLLALGTVFGIAPLGWVVATRAWTDFSLALGPVDKAVSLPGWASLGLTYIFLALVFGSGAAAMGRSSGRFLVGFTVVFAVSYACWVLGHNAYIAATPDQRSRYGVAWSLGLTGEAGYLIALLAGLVVGNLMPRSAEWLRESARPEWFIKSAIVLLGAKLGIQAAGASGLAGVILLRGFAAIIEAYLIYWALVYLLARTVFGFSREWAAPLASGISICGVSAAITTGAAIRARPVVPVVVSSLVVVFSVIELLVLPWAARAFLTDEPLVAAAWMGLAVKTDGAAISSGAITEAMILAAAAENGIHYEPGWMLLTTTTVKVFIDLFIGVWAVVLAIVWAYGIDREAGVGVPFADIWKRFPKFVFGYVAAFGALSALGLWRPDLEPALKSGTDHADQFRRIFFVMTFFAIGCGSNFRQLWAEGLARLALVYAVSLFGFIIWLGLGISWLFFQGVRPPEIAG